MLRKCRSPPGVQPHQVPAAQADDTDSCRVLEPIPEVRDTDTGVCEISTATAAAAAAAAAATATATAPAPATATATATATTTTTTTTTMSAIWAEFALAAEPVPKY